MNKLEQICNQLKQRRIELGLSYYKVAIMLKTSPAAIKQVETNGNPQLLTLIKICELYNLDIQII